MCSSWNGSCSLCTDRSGSRMLPMRRNYLESNFTSMFVYVRDWSSPHMQAFFVFVCCWNGRNALIQRSRPTKKRKLACACSAWHTLHTASYDLTNRSIANRATPINITMEPPLMTRRNNWSFMIYCVDVRQVLFLVTRVQSKKSQTLKIFLKRGIIRSCTKWGFLTDVILNGCDSQRMWNYSGRWIWGNRRVDSLYTQCHNESLCFLEPVSLGFLRDRSIRSLWIEFHLAVRLTPRLHSLIPSQLKPGLV